MHYACSLCTIYSIIKIVVAVDQRTEHTRVKEDQYGLPRQ